MRQTGYYFVKWNGEDFIGKWDGCKWSLPSKSLGKQDYDLDYISTTPITPEKMAAIDAILAMAKSLAGSRDIVAVADGLYDIINKYQLHNKP